MDNIKDKILSNSLIIASILGFSYTLFYFYSIEYLSYFGILENFIEYNIAKTTPVLFIIFLLNIYLFHLGFIFRKKITKNWLNPIFFIFISVSFFFLINIVIANNKIKIIIAYIVCLLGLAIAIGLLFIFVKLILKIKFIRKAIKAIKPDDESFYKNKKIDLIYFYVLVIFFLEIFGASILGYASARDKVNYTILQNEGKKAVVVSKFENKLLVKNIKNIEMHSLENDYYLIDVNNQSLHRLVSEEIGPFNRFSLPNIGYSSQMVIAYLKFESFLLSFLK